jgi:hypothetical protein
MLGLAPASAVGAETFLQAPDKPERPNVGADANAATIVNALRRLAENIEAGRVGVGRLDLNAKLLRDEIVEHDLTVGFVYKPEV